jgi:hypothetical protein
MASMGVCDCGYRGKPTTPGMAVSWLVRHNCERHRALAERHKRALTADANVDRTPKPCGHGGRHQHGEHATYVLDRCRCLACKQANTAYERRRARDLAYGRPRYVLAGHARAHCLHLMAQGVGIKRIRTLSGVSSAVIGKLIYGVPSEGRPPSKRVRQRTADRLLAVGVDLAGGARIPAGPTWDRVHGLMALGYDKCWIARQIGQRGPGLKLHDTMVTRAHADAVAALADRYATVPGPSLRARRHAAANGWTADLLWGDDPNLDELTAVDDDIDEIAVELALTGEKVRLTRGEQTEALRRGARPSHLGLSGATARQRLAEAS